MEPRRLPKPWVVALLVAALVSFCQVYGSLAVAKHRLFIASWDLAIYDQAVWLLAFGKGGYLTSRLIDVFAQHVQPLLWPLAALYRWLPGVPTLLWAQVVAAALGALPVFALARELSESDGVALVWAVLYLSYPAIGMLMLHDFHAEPFVLPALGAALLCAHRRRWRAYALWLALALTVKEDVGLTVGTLGLCLWLGGERRVGRLTLYGGFLYTVVMLKLVMPRVGWAGGGAWYTDEWFGHLGHGLVGVALSPLLRPGVVLHSLWTHDNLLLWIHLLVPLALLCCLKPAWFGAGLTVMFLNTVNSSWQTHRIGYQYGAPVWPLWIMAAVAGGARLTAWLGEHGVRRPVALWTPPVMALLGTWCLPAIAPATCAGPLATPLNYQAALAYWAGTRPWAAAGDRLVAMIPPGDSVAATMRPLTKVSGREHAYLFPSPFVYGLDRGPALTNLSAEALREGLAQRPVDWVLVEPDPALKVQLSPEKYALAIATLASDPHYELVGDLGALRLYHHRGPTDPWRVWRWCVNGGR